MPAILVTYLGWFLHCIILCNLRSICARSRSMLLVSLVKHVHMGRWHALQSRFQDVRNPVTGVCDGIPISAFILRFSRALANTTAP